MWPSTELTLRDEARLEPSPANSSDGASVLVIGAAFALVGAIVCSRVDDAMLRVLTTAGVLVSVRRLAAAARRPNATALESFAFAGCLGALGARTLLVGDETSHTLVVGLGFGYAAGLLMRGVARPRVSVPSLFLASTPLIAATLWKGDSASLALGGLMVLMLIGGLDRLKRIQDDLVERTARGRRFAHLARVDELTGLANRLALREIRDDLPHHAGAGSRIAVHCLDLDRFKPVNDAFGHAAGDAVLKEVAGRLTRVIGPRDFVARIGGDEFVVIQFGPADEAETRDLARSLVEAVRAPYIVEDRIVAIDASVGTAVASAAGLDLDHLIRRADAALYDDKARRRGAVAHRGNPVIPMPTPPLPAGRFPGSPPSRRRARSHG